MIESRRGLVTMVNTGGSQILASSLTKKIDFPHSYPVQWRGTENPSAAACYSALIFCL